MPHFGKTSYSRLITCHPDLQRLLLKVVEKFDCSILCGIRSKAEQDAAFAAGTSKVQWPNSKHNIEIEGELSLAIDVIPYPFAPTDWDDAGMMYMLIGYIRRVAEELDIRVRFGADWDGDGRTKDQSFHDLPHIFLILEDI